MRISDWSSDVCSSDLLVLIAAALPAESLALGDIVESQAGLWNVVRQPLGLPLYQVAGLGLASWGPLRQSDARDLRSEGWCVGQECVRTCRTTWSSYL